MRIGVRWRLLGRLVAGMMLVVLVLPFPAQATAVTIYVDQNDVNCADSGPDVGTQAKPFCSIDPAAQVAVGGQRVQVAEGTYSETVSPSHSGARGSRIVFRAAPQATVTLTGGSHGFDIDAKDWISVVGFTITGTSDTGIDVRDSTHITVRRNHVSFSGEPLSGSTAAGIVLQATNRSLVSGNTSDHNTDGGIYLNTGSTRNVIKGNILFSNARVYTRAAPGIDVRSPGNTIVGNISHDNEDSGIQLYNGANDSIVYDNLTYNNGDHGIDCLNSTGAVIVGNSVYKSTTAGINLEGASGTSASTGGTVENNISVDNGLTNTSGTHGNIRVDANSTSGTTVDYDVVYLTSSGKMMTWGSNGYSTLAAFTSASGQETHGKQANPLWKNTATADFHLSAGSPAIDSANSGAPSWPSTDIEGKSRFDDPGTANTGVGPRNYDDRGAFEAQSGSPVDAPPSASLTVTPNSGLTPLTVSANASASTDTDATPISTYAFNFGDGSAVVGPQAGATAGHTYTTAGTFTVTVTVKDTAGLSGTATKTVTVTADAPPSASLTVTPNSGLAPLTVSANASASTDTDATPISTYNFDFGDGSAATGPQAASSAPHTYTAVGTYTVTVTVKDTAGLSGTATKTVTVNPDAAPSAALTVTPNSGTAPLDVSADASASTDTDATPIATYDFDFGDGSAATGPQAASSAPHTYLFPGTYTVTVTVKDTAGLSGTATKTVTVNVVGTDDPPNAALTVTPNSGIPPLNVSADASGSTDTDATPIATYDFDFGDGSAATGPQAASSAPHTYTAVGTYTVTVTVKDTAGLSGTATKTVTVNPDAAPNAALTVTPNSGTAPLNVSADASGSTDTDATGIATYAFDFGDGSAVVGPQAGATAPHTYTAVGTYTVTVTVKDTAGLSGTATKTVTVSSGATNLVGNPGFESNMTGWNAGGRAGVTFGQASGGHSGSFAAVITNTNSSTIVECTLNDSPNWVKSTTPGTYQFSIWVRSDTPGASLKSRVREYTSSGASVGSGSSTVTLSTSWQQVTFSYNVTATGNNLDFTPFITNAPPGVCFYADDASITHP